MSVLNRSSVSIQPRVDGYEWTVEFHGGPYGRLQGWARTEAQARADAALFEEAVYAAMLARLRS